MGELEDRINSLLGDPEQLSKLTRMAQSLMGGAAPQAESAPAADTSPAASSGHSDVLDPKLLGVISRIMSGAGKASAGKGELLRAMQPYLAPERRERMERAIKIARLATLAKLALSEYGGDWDV